MTTTQEHERISRNRGHTYTFHILCGVKTRWAEPTLPAVAAAVSSSVRRIRPFSLADRGRVRYFFRTGPFRGDDFRLIIVAEPRGLRPFGFSFCPFSQALRPWSVWVSSCVFDLCVPASLREP